jgi:hypothetical protein
MLQKEWGLGYAFSLQNNLHLLIIALAMREESIFFGTANFQINLHNAFAK